MPGHCEQLAVVQVLLWCGDFYAIELCTVANVGFTFSGWRGVGETGKAVRNLLRQMAFDIETWSQSLLG